MEEHDARLRLVLTRCQQPSKCVFRSTSVKYFGHVLSGEGVSADTDKLKAAAEMPRPKNREELHRFLGMIAYLAKFVPHHSQISAQLRELMKDDVEWCWAPCQDWAFQQLQAMVTTSPVLAFYTPEATTIVSADASSYGLGAVILQIQDDGRRAPVSFASRSLTATEQRYSQIEKEALAMTWACDKFDCYLLGKDQPFQVERDHKPLQTIMNLQDVDQCPPRLQRLKMRMMRYFFEVIYVPGKNLVIEDTLSRAPVEEADNDLQDLVEGHVAMITATLPASDAMLQRIKTATSQDPQLAGLMDVLRSKWPEHKHDVKSALKVFWDLRHTLSEADGIVLKGTQIVVPRQLRTEMTKAHTGHLGIVKTKARAREAMWWPGMNADLEKWVSNCQTCTIHQNQQRSEPLLSSPLPGRPWERVAADLFQFRDRHYLILVDYYSRFPEVYHLSGLHSGNVTQGMKQIFSCHGIPDELSQ